MTETKTPEEQHDIDAVKNLEPWRHDIGLGEFSTFDVAESVGPFSDIGHPQQRAEAIEDFIKPGDNTILDLGCNAGGISFYIEQNRQHKKIVGVDSGDDKDVGINPLYQAWLCKRILDSDVQLIEYDALEFLELETQYDFIIAAGILYHIRSNGGRNENAEKRFVDLLIESANNRFVIETEPTEWLYFYLDEKDCDVVYYRDRTSTPAGVRHMVVVEV